MQESMSLKYEPASKPLHQVDVAFFIEDSDAPIVPPGIIVADQVIQREFFIDNLLV